MKNAALSVLMTACLASTLAGQAVDPNARNQHVFPQVADGLLEDGSGYTTTFVVTNVSVGFAFCSVSLTGLSGDRVDAAEASFGIAGGGVAVVSTTGLEAFDTGYAVVDCNQFVTATATYTLRSLSGITEGMATVLSAPVRTRARQVVIQGDGTGMGLALINDTSFPQTYTVTLYDADNVVQQVISLPVPARGQVSRFVDELLDDPTEAGNRFEGSLTILGGTFHAVGLFFDGNVFATMPLSAY